MGSYLITKHSSDKSWNTLRPCVKRISTEELQGEGKVVSYLCDSALPGTCRNTKPADDHKRTIVRPACATKSMFQIVKRPAEPSKETCASCPSSAAALRQ